MLRSSTRRTSRPAVRAYSDATRCASLLGYVETCVGHSQRIEDRPPEVVAEGFVGDHLHQTGADVGRPRVEPLRPGMEPERLRCQEAAQVGQRRGRVERSSLAVDQSAEVEPSLFRAGADTGHVHQGVLHADRTIRLDERKRAVALSNTHLDVAPLRQEPTDRVVQLDPGAFDQREQRNAGDRLAHRIEPPDGLVVERLTAFEIHRAAGRTMGQVTMPTYGDLVAGNLAGLDIGALEVLVDTGESSRIESGCFGVRCRVHVVLLRGPIGNCGTTGASCAATVARAELAPVVAVPGQDFSEFFSESGQPCDTPCVLFDVWIPLRLPSVWSTLLRCAPTPRASDVLVESGLVAVREVQAWADAQHAALVAKLSSDGFAEATIARAAKSSIGAASKSTQRSKTLEATPRLAETLGDGQTTAAHVDAVTRAAAQLPVGAAQRTVRPRRRPRSCRRGVDGGGVRSAGGVGGETDPVR